MSRYIDAEIIKLLMKQDRLLQGNCEYELWKQEVDRQVNALPCIDLDDYVPKDFHDKTCEAMAKAHQEEIADMVSVVRCKECRYCKKKRGTFKGEPIIYYRCTENNRDVESDDYCSFGEMWTEAVIASKTEPQTDGYMTAEQTEDYRKMLDKAEHKVYGNIEDEPQTERRE